MSAREALYRCCNRDLNVYGDIREIFAAETPRSTGLESKLGVFKKESARVQTLINRGQTICRNHKSTEPMAVAQKLDAVKTDIYANAHIAGIMDTFNQLANVTFLRNTASVRKRLSEPSTAEITKIYGDYLDSAAKVADKICTALHKIEEEFSHMSAES
jgi:hypothetical protein